MRETNVDKTIFFIIYLKSEVGLGPRILSLRVYHRKSFISFHVQAVVPVILVKPIDNRPRSIYQYSSMGPRLLDQIYKFLSSSFFCPSIPKRDLDTRKTTPNIEV